MDIEMERPKSQDEITDEQRKYIGWIAKAIYGEVNIDYINPRDDDPIPVYVMLANGQKVVPTVEQIQEGWLQVKAEIDNAPVIMSETDSIKSDVETLKTEIGELKALIRQLLEKG